MSLLFNSNSTVFKYIEEGCINLIFGIVLSFLVIILLQSFGKNATSCNYMDINNNKLPVLTQMETFNNTCFLGNVDKSFISIIFMLILYGILSYFLFIIFKNMITDKLNQSDNINSCPLFGTSKPVLLNQCNLNKSLMLPNNNSSFTGGGDSITNCNMGGCPFGFGSNKKPKFIDESSLKKDIFGDMKKRGLCPSNIDVKVASNIDLNDDTNDISKLAKTILGKFLPGMLPTILNKFNNHKNHKNHKNDESTCSKKNINSNENPTSEPIAEPVTEPVSEPVAEPVAEPVSAPAYEPKAKISNEPVHDTLKNKEHLVNNISSFIGNIKDLLKDSDLNLDSLIM